MEWNALYGAENRPTFEDISGFINNGMWEEINGFLQSTYNVAPQTEYSGCSGQPGWNVKYKKGGKSLCTLYPMDGYFIALVVIGAREEAEADLLIPLCSGYTRELYRGTAFSAGGRWLMMSVTDEKILEDAKNLIKIRVKPKQGASYRGNIQ